MRELKGTTVSRGGPRDGQARQPTDKVAISVGGGGRISLRTRVPWAGGASEVAFDIPPADFRDVLFNMILADARTVHDAYASLSKSMAECLVQQACRAEE